MTATKAERVRTLIIVYSGKTKARYDHPGRAHCVAATLYTKAPRMTKPTCFRAPLVWLGCDIMAEWTARAAVGRVRIARRDNSREERLD
jgi:hypothetical protein